MPYVIDGRAAALEPEPRNLDGPIYVPLREVVEALGGKVGWDKASESATADLRGTHVRIFPNSAAVHVEGKGPHQMSVPPFMTEGQTWVPVEFFEAFGIVALADAATNTVTVNS